MSSASQNCSKEQSYVRSTNSRLNVAAPQAPSASYAHSHGTILRHILTSDEPVCFSNHNTFLFLTWYHALALTLQVEHHIARFKANWESHQMKRHFQEQGRNVSYIFC